MVGRGSKTLKVIIDHFSSHFGQFGNSLIFIGQNILRPKLVGGEGGGAVKKSETNFRPIFSAFQPSWNNFDFFVPY